MISILLMADRNQAYKRDYFMIMITEITGAFRRTARHSNNNL
jgi:hypothetical protein